MAANRAILPLGKFRVVDITKGVATIQLGGTTQMKVELKDFMDVRPGDILTFYTEVLIKDALSSKTPQQ